MEKPTTKWSPWLNRISSRKKQFEGGWYKQAKAANDMYDGGKDADQCPFNILYANTEVLLPSLYSATPRPETVPRFDNPKEPAQAVNNLLTVLLDDNSPGQESFDDAIGGAVLSALIPGGGGVRLRYREDQPLPLGFEEYKYDQVIWGYAKKWSRVPWLCFLHPMTKEEIQADFRVSPERAKKLQAPTQEEQDTNPTRDKGPHTFFVYELWIKSERRVVFLCEELDEPLLREVGDPMKLKGFYPTPNLLTLVQKPSTLDPTPLYEYYKNQAEELNRVTVRLNRILAAIKVRGAYNPLIGRDMEKILSDSEMENGLVPANSPMQLDGAGFEKQIWLIPIDKLIMVAQQLYIARQSIKQVIQELTGLADIVRGSSVASETATAQELKNKWGTVRLRRMQRIVSLYCRDLLRLATDAATTLIPPEQWKAITGLPYLLEAEKQQLAMQLQQQQMQAQFAAEQAAVMGQPAPQPQPPDPTILKQLAAPTWEQIISRLSDDAGRCYVIDIETSSTIDADSGADKQEVTEFMTALGQLLTGLAPLVQMGGEGIAAAKAITLAVCKRFKLGREVEDQLKALPTTPPPSPEADKGPSQEEIALQQDEHQFRREEMAFKRQELEQKMQQSREKHQMEMQKLAMQQKQMVLQATLTPPQQPATAPQGKPRPRPPA